MDLNPSHNNSFTMDISKTLVHPPILKRARPLGVNGSLGLMLPQSPTYVPLIELIRGYLNRTIFEAVII